MTPVNVQIEGEQSVDVHSHVQKNGIAMVERHNESQWTPGALVETPMGTGRVRTLAREDDGMLEVVLDWKLAGGEHAVLYTLAERLWNFSKQDNESGPNEGAEVLPPPKNKKKKMKRRKTREKQ